jgi:glycolate oxidase iron-sulfur subunit
VAEFYFQRAGLKLNHVPAAGGAAALAKLSDGSVEAMLSVLGATVLPAGDAQLCCGAAGTYGLLQPQISTQLRQRKQTALTAAQPQLILSANLGCMLQLAAGSDVPVQHWVEWVDSQLA